MTAGTALPRPADVLPHKAPFLFVDGLDAFDPGRRAVAHWTPTDDHFAGLESASIHLAGALVIEALAQTGAMAILLDGRFEGLVPLFGGIDNARFPQQVRPGDRVELTVELDRVAASGGRGHGVATVDDRVVCEARMMFMMVDLGAVPAAPAAHTPDDGPEHAIPPGEHADVNFRLLLSHETGVFEPSEGCVPGAVVRAGTVAGYVGRAALVFREAGVFGRHLAIRGERVRAQQPVAWIDVPPKVRLVGAV
jgi:3-hydroxyacyl-[acyl-carrier-protein] dehydratase